MADRDYEVGFDDQWHEQVPPSSGSRPEFIPETKLGDQIRRVVTDMDDSEDMQEIDTEGGRMWVEPPVVLEFANWLSGQSREGRPIKRVHIAKPKDGSEPIL